MAARDCKPLPNLTAEDIERFYGMIDKTPGQGPKGDCHCWTGARAHGYGKFLAADRRLGANRVALFLYGGKDPFPLFACHHCDWPPCCRGEHLFPGTQQDNLIDMANKGRVPSGDGHFSRLRPERLARGDRHSSVTHPERIPRGDKHGARLHPETVQRGEQHFSHRQPELVARGERCRHAKITSQQAAEICKLYAQGETQKDIGKLFNMSQSGISAIVTGLTWKHVLRP